MADRAVLAGRVHRLQDDQQRVGVLRVELVLQRREPQDAVAQQLLRVLLLHAFPGVAGVEVVHRHFAFGTDRELLDGIDAVLALVGHAEGPLNIRAGRPASCSPAPGATQDIPSPRVVNPITAGGIPQDQGRMLPVGPSWRPSCSNGGTASMFSPRSLSVQSKLIAAFVLLTLVTVGVVSWIGYVSARAESSGGLRARAHGPAAIEDRDGPEHSQVCAQ